MKDLTQEIEEILEDPMFDEEHIMLNENLTLIHWTNLKEYSIVTKTDSKTVSSLDELFDYIKQNQN